MDILIWLCMLKRDRLYILPKNLIVLSIIVSFSSLKFRHFNAKILYSSKAKKTDEIDQHLDLMKDQLNLVPNNQLYTFTEYSI